MNILKSKLKNQTNGRKYITGQLSKYEINANVDDPDILELLKYHPTKHINIENIDYLQVKLHPTWKRPTLYYKYRNKDTMDDIAYVDCIKNLFGKYNRDERYVADVMNAFRNESHIGTKQQFFIDNTTVVDEKFVGCCSKCNMTTTKITTDHYPITYQEIFDNFILIERIVLSEQDIYETERCELKLKNSDFAEKWRTFHDSIANYRLLCKSCNSSCGSYGYVRKT